MPPFAPVWDAGQPVGLTAQLTLIAPASPLGLFRLFPLTVRRQWEDSRASRGVRARCSLGMAEEG